MRHRGGSDAFLCPSIVRPRFSRKSDRFRSPFNRCMKRNQIFWKNLVSFRYSFIVYPTPRTVRMTPVHPVDALIFRRMR